MSSCALRSQSNAAKPEAAVAASVSTGKTMKEVVPKAVTPLCPKSKPGSKPQHFKKPVAQKNEPPINNNINNS